MIHKDGVFGRWIGHKSRDFMSEVNAFVKETQTALASPSTTWERLQQKDSQVRSGPSLDTKPARALILDSSLQNWEMLFMSHPAHDISLQQPERAETDDKWMEKSTTAERQDYTTWPSP